MVASELKILEPYDRREAISIQDASELFGIPPRTLRRWSTKYRIGKRLGGYKRPWSLSRVALPMVIDRNWSALAAYHRGARKEEIVANYYRREGLGKLLDLPLFCESKYSDLALRSAAA